MRNLKMKLLILVAALVGGAAALNGCSKTSTDASSGPTFTLKSSNSQN